MWSDNETTQDLLGFQIHADLIRSIVTNPEMLPVTIGIFGDWGSGKTSVMRMLERALDFDNYGNGSPEREKYERVACLYFNGWLFEGYDDAKAAILTSILLQLSEHKRLGPKIQDMAVGLMKSVDRMRLAKLGLRTILQLTELVLGEQIVPPSLVGVEGLLNNIGEEQSEHNITNQAEKSENKKDGKSDLGQLTNKNKTAISHLDVRSFRVQFSELIKKCKIDSLIVLIDDLDRCSPERIIDNLEAIKLFLNVERTAFVIGADPRIVSHAIATRYKTFDIQKQDNQGESADRLVIDYLEKLIQIPYHLPRLSPAEVETYMVLLFCLQDLGEEFGKKCVVACATMRSENRYSVFGYASVKNVIGEEMASGPLSKNLTFCATAAPLITEGLKGNPRQVKRFLNAFVLRKQLAEEAKLVDIRDEVLVKLMVLEYGHPAQYRQLYEWQTTGAGYPKEIQDLESSNSASHENGDNEEDSEKKEDVKKIPTGWEGPFMQKWIEMTPSLADVDLRDYFWISRDRLQSTLSGISMVSPIVRRILDNLVSDNPGRRNMAIKEAVNLDEDERSSLLMQLEKYLHRHPNQKQGYDALQALIESNIGGAPETLANVLDKCPADAIPPAMAFSLKTLVKSKSGLKEILEPVLKQLMESDTPIGRALKKRNVKD